MANSGQGVATKYEKPLAGNSSVEQLVEVITDTMPEDDAGACVGEDAVAVASYIHGRFYNGTPRKKLARLTGTQLSQSLADLFSHFTNIASVNEQRGLHGEYFEESGTRKDKRKIERD